VSSPRVLSGAQRPLPRWRVSAADVLAALFLLASFALALVVTIRGLETDRMQQAENPEFMTAAPPHIFYDPADRQRLNGELAGCAITFAVLAFGCWRLRRRPPEPRLERLSETPARIIESREKWIAAPARAVDARVKPKLPPPRRRASSSGAIAAERLAAVVWNDQFARQRESA
jgi:hypothetical protein